MVHFEDDPVARMQRVAREETRCSPASLFELWLRARMQSEEKEEDDEDLPDKEQ